VAFLNLCELPDHLWFHVPQDVWLEVRPDGVVRIGMTDPAVTRAGKILYVRARPGRQVAAGRSIGSVESAKWVGPVPSPVPGTVTAVNPLVLADPSLLNRDPYGDGWLAELATDHGAEALRRHGLLFGPEAVLAYGEKIRQERITCVRCSGPPTGEEG
jgi:glycine cleavage system H protein